MEPETTDPLPEDDVQEEWFGPLINAEPEELAASLLHQPARAEKPARDLAVPAPPQKNSKNVLALSASEQACH